MAEEFQWFFTAFSVRPGSKLEISRQRLPTRRCDSKMIRFSLGAQLPCRKNEKFSVGYTVLRCYGVVLRCHSVKMLRCYGVRSQLLLRVNMFISQMHGATRVCAYFATAVLVRVQHEYDCCFNIQGPPYIHLQSRSVPCEWRGRGD